MTGVYTVVIQVFEEYSAITKTFSFVLTVSCVNTVTSTSSIADQLYYIGDPKISIPVPTYALTPSACPLELTYLVKQVSGVALPSAI